MITFEELGDLPGDEQAALKTIADEAMMLGEDSPKNLRDLVVRLAIMEAAYLRMVRASGVGDSEIDVALSTVWQIARQLVFEAPTQIVPALARLR